MNESDDLTNRPVEPSFGQGGIMLIEEKIEKTEKRKQNRSRMIATGGGVSLIWVIIFGYAVIDSTSNPASVAFLGVILSLPILAVGTAMIIIGIITFFIASAQLKVLERERQALEASSYVRQDPSTNLEL